MTLDACTAAALADHARREGKEPAALARALIGEGLARGEASAGARELASDYAAGRRDALALLADLERGQLVLLEDRDA